MNNNNEELPEQTGVTDPSTAILAAYLCGFNPAERYGHGVYILTTDEIISDLDVMADVSKEAVNAALVANGFKCGRNDYGTFGWMVMTAID